MARDPKPTVWPFPAGAARGLAALTSALLLSACAGTSDLIPKPDMLAAEQTDQPATPQSELQKATVYWGQEFAKAPNQLQPALNYARNLKALGQKRQALSVLQRASSVHGTDAELAGEYGRLALDLDQVSVASRLLEVADSATKPDWRVISARGTVLAKQGQYKQAIPFYERALTLEKNQPGVINNLAMAHAMSGDPKKAEELLRLASNGPDTAPKIRQNLALVLGLQGRYDESKVASVADLPSDAAAANADYIRSIVKLPPKTALASVAASPEKPAASSFTTKVARTAPAEVAATAKPPIAGAPATPLFKPAALDVSSAATATPEWTTNVANAAKPQPASLTASPAAALKGSSR